jgi:hypothetical protein
VLSALGGLDLAQPGRTISTRERLAVKPGRNGGFQRRLVNSK